MAFLELIAEFFPSINLPLSRANLAIAERLGKGGFNNLKALFGIIFG
jgi:hypothetical protein